MSNITHHIPEFTTDYKEILNRLQTIDPIKYGRSRNFVDGSVTYLSPYISRGVISTKLVYNTLLERGFHPSPIEKFIQELAWRDYWQQVWITKGNDINQDLKHKQSPVESHEISKSLINHSTKITAIDSGIKGLYETGYMHNHLRMYVASIACNIGRNYWKLPAKWMYYHLLDGDWASNALSWQWVAGTNSNKKYVANQENINKYCHTNDTNTFLDVSYEAFNNLEIPSELKPTEDLQLETPLPKQEEFNVNTNQPTYVYNYYNLDPEWDKKVSANRILLLEPSVFKKYPVSKNSIDFALQLSKNIDGIKVFIGEFKDLVETYNLTDVHFKKHPLNSNYKGTEHDRDWMFSVKGYYSSFFGFWKKCKKEIKF